MKDDKGFTLIEVVVAIAILAAVILSIMSFQVSGVKGFARESTTAINQTKVRRASNDIIRELRRSSTTKVDILGALELDYSDGKRIRIFYDSPSESIKMTYYIKQPSGVYTVDYTSVLVEGISNFTYSVTGKKVSLKIESNENSEGNTYKLDAKITIRS